MHIHVSERESAHVWPDGQQDDARWEDCAWCVLVEVLHDAGLIGDGDTTHDFAERLRAASGEPPTGGSNIDDLRRGVSAVLGITLPPTVAGTDAIIAALQTGSCALVNGSMGTFPPGSSWDTAFAGFHSLYVARRAEGDFIRCDPLAPEGIGYSGEPTTESDLRAFLSGFPYGGQAVILPLAASTGGDMTAPVAEYVVGTAVIRPPDDEAAAGHKANVRSAPVISSATLLRAVEREDWGGVVGWVEGAEDSGSTRWLLHIAPDGSPEYTHSSNVPDGIAVPGGGAPVEVPVPPTAESCKPFTDAARAEAFAVGRAQGIDEGYAGAQQGATVAQTIVFGPKPG